MKLADLFQESIDMQAGAQQQYVLSELPERIRSLGVKLWKPGDAIQSQGRRILVGVTEYVRGDLELLDAVLGVLGNSQLEIFILAECRSQADVELYVPGVTPVINPPVIGIWEDGVLVKKASGREAKQILQHDICGSSEPVKMGF
jgi:hypothetical protein